MPAIAARRPDGNHHTHNHEKSDSTDDESSSPVTAARFADQRLGRFASLRSIDQCNDEATLASTMLRVQINLDDRLPLWEQVATELRREIAEGECRPGERLPPARDIAAVCGVNTNTVLRALRELRDEGILDFRRGRGITITDNAPQRSVVVNAAQELLDLARHHGYRKAEILDLITQLPAKRLHRRRLA